MALSSETSPYYFISYCRQEVTFVDNLSKELSKRNIRNWVDFRNLVPGQPWQPQLDCGVGEAAAILLVVSKASMASGPVKDEWTKSLAAGKRIILLIFEACPLDERLTQLEWVDFTGKFENAMQDLVARLNQPQQKMTAPPPQAGMKLPDTVKFFIGLSILATILAIAGGIATFLMATNLALTGISYEFSHTQISAEVSQAIQFQALITSGLLMSVFFLWIPAVWSFVRVPWLVWARKHNAEQLSGALNRLVIANFALLVIPLTSIFTNIWSVLQSEAVGKTLMFFGCISAPLMLIIFGVCFLVYLLLVSDQMYRWAGPTGAIIKATRPDKSKYERKVKPIRVGLEFAPQDRLYADAFKSSITKAGLIYTENPQDAEIVLPLLSAYKDKSAFDPEQKTLIPVLLQKCNVDPCLSQLQWVDLRYGQDSIDAVVHLLDEPKELLHTLGVLPVRAPVLPTWVKRLNTVLSIVMSISLVFLILSLMDGGTFSSGGFLNILILAGTFFLRRYIMDRKLKNLSFLSYWPVVGFAVGMAVLSFFATWNPAVLFVPFAWLVVLLMFPKEVRMWLPAA